MKFDVLTLFPEMFEIMKQSIFGKAIEKGIITLQTVNIRDFSKNKHKKVDDTPYGGGAGMVMMPDVVYDAYQSVASKDAKVIYMSPHYEGIDQRVLDKIVDEEISIGDYVLTGGEIPAMVLMDSVSRYIEGVLKQDSVKEESFSNGLLEYPQYTRPEIFQGEKVPEILLTGHHGNIEKWRQEQAFKITKQKRPDLLKEKGNNEVQI